MNTFKQPPTQDQLLNCSMQNLIMYILTETESDCETLERYDRYTLLGYVNHFELQKGFEESFMLFEDWVKCDPDDLANFLKTA